MSVSKICTFDPGTKIWSGLKVPLIYNTDANLGYLILQRLIQTPDRLFQISDDSGTCLSNSDIYQRSLKVANYLSTKCKICSMILFTPLLSRMLKIQESLKNF